ncbi:MAG: IS21 family transposase, partial [Mesorhizobium sp.]
GRLVASHPVLEGRRQYRIDPAHRQGLARHAARKTAPDIIVGRLGDHVARRSLDFYQAVAERLAVAGSRS